MDIQAYISSGILEQYVLGLCSPEEIREIENYCQLYPDIKLALQQTEASFEQTMFSNALEPGIEADHLILAHLKSLGNASALSVTELTKEEGAGVKPLRSKVRWAYLAAAASLLLIMSLYFNFHFYKQYQELANQPKQELPPTLPPGDYAIMLNPAITPVGMYGVGSHAICRCTLYWDKKTKKAFVMIHHLPQSDDTVDYQLWAMVDGKPVSVGILKDEIRGRFIELSGVPDLADSFVLTLEPAGGSKTPTMEEVYLDSRI